MRVSAKAQYACIAMLELAAHHGDQHALVQVKTIADTHGISQRFLVQILLQLKAAGLVRSARGAAGGYQLARPPETVTLADVIHAIDQAEPATPSALRRCGRRWRCRRSRRCCTRWTPGSGRCSATPLSPNWCGARSSAATCRIRFDRLACVKRW